MNSKLAIQSIGVSLDGPDADVEFASDLPVGFTFSHASKDFVKLEPESAWECQLRPHTLQARGAP
jgi:hypothetical protein